jgi:hypothetical protein
MDAEGSRGESKEAVASRLWIASLAAMLALLAFASSAWALPDPTTVSNAGSPNQEAISGEDCEEQNLNRVGGTDFFPDGVTRYINGPGTFVLSDASNYAVADDSQQTIYASGGDDLVYGGGGGDTIVGGKGQDYLHGESGPDFMVGDHWGSGDVTESTNNDCVAAGAGNDFLVGDNAADSGSALGTGNQNDILLGGAEDDWAVGDRAAWGGALRQAKGGGNDWLAGSQDNDHVIGDNYASGGAAAIGGGSDSVNTGPAIDHGVGDNYSEGGSAQVPSGQGNDTGMIWQGRDSGLHLQMGADTGWGDNWAPSGGSASGGGDDIVGGLDGADTLYGGPGDDLLKGDSSEDCDHDVATAECIPGSHAEDFWNDSLNGQDGDDDLRGYWGWDDVCNGNDHVVGDSADISTGWHGHHSCDSTPNVEFTYIGPGPTAP